MLLCFSSSSCAIKKDEKTEISTCPVLVQNLGQTLNSTQFPEHFRSENPVRQGNEFDPNKFFETLTNVSMQKGYMLDYVFFMEDSGGEPIVYARPTSGKRYLTVDEFLKENGGDVSDYIIHNKHPDYLNFVEVKDSPQGYFEYVLLSIYAEQFYLWFVANYSYIDIVCDSNSLESIIKRYSPPYDGETMTEEQIANARKLQLKPVVKVEESQVKVNLLGFDEFTGFTLYTYVISRTSPHSLIDLSSENVVHYESGWVY
jgi:hypothetical protein